jgi:hypothetical protein
MVTAWAAAVEDAAKKHDDARDDECFLHTVKLNRREPQNAVRCTHTLL